MSLTVLQQRLHQATTSVNSKKAKKWKHRSKKKRQREELEQHLQQQHETEQVELEARKKKNIEALSKHNKVVDPLITDLLDKLIDEAEKQEEEEEDSSIDDEHGGFWSKKSNQKEAEISIFRFPENEGDE